MSDNLFLRKWQLQIIGPADSGGQTLITLPDPNNNAESLRVTFDIETHAWQGWWFANICIYNMNEQVTEFIVTQGRSGNTPPAPTVGTAAPPITQNMQVILSAGYQNGAYGEIFNGFVLQPLFERENQVDFKITLNCVVSLVNLDQNLINESFAALLYTQEQIVQTIAKNSFHPISVGTISTTLTKTAARSQTFFGTPKQHLRDISRDNGMSFWLQGKGLLNVGKVDDSDITVNAKNPIVCMPGNNPEANAVIVGTPQQTQFGVNCRLLLNPNIEVTKPMKCISIQNSQVRQYIRQLGVLPGILSQDGIYAIIGAKFTGDTRGQEWYVDVTGALLAKDKLALTSEGLVMAQQWTGTSQ